MDSVDPYQSQSNYKGFGLKESRKKQLHVNNILFTYFRDYSSKGNKIVGYYPPQICMKNINDNANFTTKSIKINILVDPISVTST